MTAGDATTPATVDSAATIPDRRARAIHVASLVLAGVLLLWLDRHQWFIADEWGMLVDRKVVGGDGRLGIWDAHNSHLAASVVVAYRALFQAFGVRTYLPYLVVMILCQVAAMHLLWRVMLRLGIRASIATAAALVFALLGQGYEITTGAFGMQNAAALALGLGALLVMPESGPFSRRDGAAWALSLAALLTSSGVAIPIVIVLGLVALVRRGWRPALAVVALPAAVFLVWYAIHGEQATRAQGALGTEAAIRGMPTFVAHGLWWSLERLFDLDGGGPFVLLGVAVLVGVALRWREPRWQVALCIAAGAPVYLALTTVGRGGYGLEAAASSRYSYVVLALLLPLLTLAVDQLVRGHALGAAIAITMLGALVVLQVVILDRHATASGLVEQANKRRVIAAAEILQRGEPTVGIAVPESMANVSNPELLTLARDGDLPGNVDPSERDRLDARLYLQVGSFAGVTEHQSDVEVVSGPLPEPATACAILRPDGDPLVLRFRRPGAVTMTGRPGAPLSLQLVARDAGHETSSHRPIGIPRGGTTRLVDVERAADLRIEAAKRAVEVCGLPSPT